MYERYDTFDISNDIIWLKHSHYSYTFFISSYSLDLFHCVRKNVAAILQLKRSLKMFGGS